MMKLHSAISPSMNDQWSGKTLRICFFMAVARPVRSSSVGRDGADRVGLGRLGRRVALVVATLLVSMLFAPRPGRAPRLHVGVVALPEAWPDGFGEVALRHEVPLVVHLDGQLREVAGGRAEDDLAVVGEVEGRLVARAEQVVGGPLVQRDRAAHVRADLGVADDALDRPVLAARPGGDVVGLHPEQDHRALGLGDLEVDALDETVAVIAQREDRLRLAVDQVADLEVGRP